jgi:hypothetical protein
MGNRTKVPMEQTETRSLVVAFLDYLRLRHGAIVEVIVRDWLFDKEKRLAWKSQQKD